MSKPPLRAQKARRDAPHHFFSRPAFWLPIALIIAISAIFYFVIVPRHSARQFDQAVAQPRAELMSSFQQLAKATDLTDLAENSTRRGQSEQLLRQRIADTHNKLQALDEANQLRPMPLVFGSTEYKTAKMKQRNYAFVTRQSRAVLSDFDTLVTYLRTRSDHTDTLQARLDAFNRLTDLNTLNGQGGAQRQTAVIIDQAAAAIRDMGPPPGTAAGTADPSETFAQASAGFRRLGGALDRGAEAEVYAAARDIEAATARTSSADTPRLIQAVQESATIKEVNTLAEKLESAD